MKKSVVFLLAVMILSLGLTSYPNEYPLYLRALGFQKEDVRNLKNGDIWIHALKEPLPGEFGVTAARVINVPPYYFRDYYLAIENFKTMRNFQNVGQFRKIATSNDLRPLEFTNDELLTLERCKSGLCEMNLSTAEIAMLSPNKSRDELADRYRKILLQRLLDYKKSGLHDPTSEISVKRFPDLAEYFQPSQQLALKYPAITDQQMIEHFYWAKEFAGKQTAIALHHIMVQSVGDDVLIMDRMIHNSIPGLMASMAVFHLISYADRGAPSTLVVIQQRIQSDLKAKPFEIFRKNYYNDNLKRQLFTLLKSTGDAMEHRYKERVFATFPFALKSRDER
jgi:hypothetical protein